MAMTGLAQLEIGVEGGPMDAAAEIDLRPLLGNFETGLWLPRLRERELGAWSLRVIPMTSARGYWGGIYRMERAAVLMGPFETDQAAWMSLVPMEVESQEIGIAAAHGHTVVLGLGLGWCAANVALNPAVERVTVVERDPDIIALVEALGLFGQLPEAARAKVEVIQGDALAWRPEGRVDCVHADLWAKFVEPRKWDEVRRLQDKIGAGTLYFWGQEMELWRLACRARGAVPERLEAGELDTLVAATGLPLILDDGADYAGRIAEAARWWTPREGVWWDTQ